MAKGDVLDIEFRQDALRLVEPVKRAYLVEQVDAMIALAEAGTLPWRNVYDSLAGAYSEALSLGAL